MSRPTVKDLQAVLHATRELLADAKAESADLREIRDRMRKEVDQINLERQHEREERARLAEEARTGIIKLRTNACLCGMCLEEAALQLGPARVYEVTVAPQLELLARKLLRTYARAHRDNVFAPWVNLFVMPKLAPAGWRVSANGKTVMSDGVS